MRLGRRRLPECRQQSRAGVSVRAANTTVCVDNDPPLRFPRPPRPPRPPGLPPELQQRWKELLDHHEKVAELDHFALLGVSDDAPVEDVQRAFAIQVQSFHPDRLPDELAVLKPYAMRIVVHLNDARRLLSNPAQREDYLRRLGRASALAPECAEWPRPMPNHARLARAAELREQARTFAQQKRYGRAAATILTSRALDDTRAEYAALHAWLLYEHDGRPSAPSEDTRRLLAYALERNDQCEQVHLYLATVLEHAGEVEQAMEHFRRAVELNPDNTEAARKLSLQAASAAEPCYGWPRFVRVLRSWCRR